FGGRHGEGVLGGSLLGGGSSRLAGPALPGRNGLNRLAGSRLGATLLGGSVFSRPGTSLSGSRPKARSAAFGSHQPRFRGPGVLTRLTRALRRTDRPKKPGKRWLRASGLGSGAGPGGGLGRKPGLRSPGRGWLGRPRTGL